MMSNKPVLRILGIRGIPANHGGFETFAEQLALHLRDRGWRVVVYCQEDGEGGMYEDHWQGVERVHFPVKTAGALGTMIFDWKAIAHAAQHGDLCLTLGYNTAMFCARLRLAGVPNVINMDGIEWSRAKWGKVAKTWFWMNDWAGCWLGNHLVADHPEICNLLQTRARPEKISTIAYGAPVVDAASDESVRALGLMPGEYMTLIARPEPENLVLDIVKAFSARPRGVKLAVLGDYRDANPYHRAVLSSASEEVMFLGAIYDKPQVQALRFHALAYLHGHQVGGTNPSLVEAMGAGNPVIAHDNRFNRWVAGESARYFRGAKDLDALLTDVLNDRALLDDMGRGSRARFGQHFTWENILSQYERMLEPFLPAESPTLASKREVMRRH